jgi:predicted house-cleaning noncanonical NTP pyrophosphatase (MazG superfamily)
MSERMDEKFPILRLKEDLLRLEELYEKLPVVYQCPFCGFISPKDLNKRIRVEVFYYGWPYEDEIVEEEIDFCECPKCKTKPKKHYKDSEVLRLSARKLKVMTQEYKQLRDELREKLRDEMKFFIKTDEITYRGWSEEDLTDYPEILKLVRIAYYRVIAPRDVIPLTAQQ